MATPLIGRSLGGFHHWVVRKITGNNPRQEANGIFQYPQLEESMWEAGLEDMETEFSRRHNMVEQFISNRTILDLCLEAERRPGA